MSISQNIKKVRELITQTELSSNRQPNSVLLLAVSKEQSPELIREAFQQGIRHFGENYFQEAHEKILALKDLPISWHYIGPIQSNKTKGIAKYFNWVHSIDRNKTAKLLNQFRLSNYHRSMSVYKLIWLEKLQNQAFLQNMPSTLLSK